jgi:hypothetical protein
MDSDTILHPDMIEVKILLKTESSFLSRHGKKLAELCLSLNVLWKEKFKSDKLRYLAE